MNKTKLAREIDHALKAADFQKSVIKGIGWKGNGSPYRREGYRIDTTGNKCVIIRYHDWVKANYLARHYDELASEGHMQLIKSKERMTNALIHYKGALVAYNVMLKTDELDLPYLEITETTESKD